MSFMLAATTAVVGAPSPDQFPQSEATITQWISSLSSGESAVTSIYQHAWGLWSLVTGETSMTSEGQTLRAFETWVTPDGVNGPPRAGRLRAFQHLASNPLGFVRYNPAAAQHVRAEGLDRSATLATLLAGGEPSIPAFSSSTLVVKAVYRLASASALVDGRYYALPVWEGPPATPQAYGPDAWPHSVWVDLGRGATDRTGVYALADFISFRLSAQDALRANAEQPGTGAVAGDVALLVGMHVASRETARWTWQTFWWAPDADNPPAPSGAAQAQLRPAMLDRAARHYAMAAAYEMATPNPPVFGGSNGGRSVYAYNPYIEAALGTGDLPDSVAGFGPDGTPQPNNVGIESNCMSCHARATFNPDHLSTAPRLSGARYVDLGDPDFVGTLQTDFLWSIANPTASTP
jgi:hypothetical protein